MMNHEILESVVQHLQNTGTDFWMHNEHTVKWLSSCGGIDCVNAAFIGAEGALLHLISHLPLTVPLDRRLSCAELFTRINNGLKLGAFCLDMEDGEVEYRVHLPVGEGPFEERRVAFTLMAGVVTVQKAFPALAALLYAGSSPEQAWQSLDCPEKEQSEPQNHSRFGNN